MTTDTHVVLTVRGTLVPPNLEAARVLHNDTAGSDAGIAAARSFGDLSHKVYAPVLGVPISSAKDGELLFLDAWCDPMGIGQFFSNAHVQGQAAHMFSKRDPTIWMRARGSFSWVLQAPTHRTDRFVAMIRGPVASPEAAIETFAKVDRAIQRDARRRGLISHEIFIKMPMPGDTGPHELLGIDIWHDMAGMAEQYTDRTAMADLGQAFSGPTDNTVWKTAPGNWSEW
jgi:hypothetical protein